MKTRIERKHLKLVASYALKLNNIYISIYKIYSLIKTCTCYNPKESDYANNEARESRLFFLNELHNEILEKYFRAIEIEQTIYYLINIYKLKLDENLDNIINSFTQKRQNAQKIILFHAPQLTEKLSDEKESNKHQNSKANTFTLEDAQNNLYDILETSLNKELYLNLKSYIEETENLRISTISKRHYQMYAYQFEKQGIDRFYTYLKFLNTRTNIETKTTDVVESTKFLTENKKALYLEMHFYKLSNFLFSYFEHNKEKIEKVRELTATILSSIKNELLTLDYIDKRINLLKDYITIWEKNEKGLNIHITFGNKNKIEILSEEIKLHINVVLSDILALNSSQDKNALTEELNKSKLIKNKQKHIILKKIATVLIESNIMTYVSSNGNKYNLSDEFGNEIGLRKKDAELIYDIMSTLNLEIKKSKGEEKNMTVFYYDRTDVIKERLETVKNIELSDIDAEVNYDILDFF